MRISLFVKPLTQHNLNWHENSHSILYFWQDFGAGKWMILEDNLKIKTIPTIKMMEKIKTTPKMNWRQKKRTTPKLKTIQKLKTHPKMKMNSKMKTTQKRKTTQKVKRTSKMNFLMDEATLHKVIKYSRAWQSAQLPKQRDGRIYQILFSVMFSRLY